MSQKKINWIEIDENGYSRNIYFEAVEPPAAGMFIEIDGDPFQYLNKQYVDGEWHDVPQEEEEYVPSQLDMIEETQLIMMEAMADQYEQSLERELTNMEVQATILPVSSRAMAPMVSWPCTWAAFHTSRAWSVISSSMGVSGMPIFRANSSAPVPTRML